MKHFVNLLFASAISVCSAITILHDSNMQASIV